MYRFLSGTWEVLLAHPGGPYFYNKDEGYWTIPKGEIEEGEEPFTTAIREFSEETGISIEILSCNFIDLGEVKQKGGKRIHAWAYQGNWDGILKQKSFFDMEYPPKSGKIQRFPEIDQAKFFSLVEAKRKVNPAQVAFIERLESYVETK